MTIPPNGDNIGTITDANTFRVWFDSTNRLITKLNPLEFYSITAGSGEVAGITIDLNRTTGAAVVGLSLPGHITGPHKFGGGITFENEVRFSGSTVDFGGATLFGQVVRTVNGLTGDLTLTVTGIGVPAGMGKGDMLIYNGSTMVAYDLFTGGSDADGGFSADGDINKFFRFGGSGGMQLGTADAGPLGVISANRQSGNIELFGATGAMVSYHDSSYNAYGGGALNEEGSFYYFGRINGRSTDNMGVVITGGGSTTGFETNTNAPYVVIDQTSRELGLFGITSPNAPVHYQSRSLGVGRAADVILQDPNGITFSVRMYPASIAKNNEGILTETLPRDKGFRTLPSTRFITSSDIDSVGFDIMASDNAAKGNFTIFGEPAAGISLAPVLNVRNTGDVVIGGITGSDSGSTWGSLNLASGKLVLGGDAGVTFSSGIQVVSSNGISASYKVMFPDALLNDEVDLEPDINIDTFRNSSFGINSNAIQVGPLGNTRQYLGAGGVGLATNATVTQTILGTDISQFARVASSAGVTYVSAIAYRNGSNYISYNGEEVNITIDRQAGLITGRAGNPYDKIICFKNERNENLVGDFEIEFVFPPGDYDGNIGTNRQRSEIMGVAVFVDMDDDALLGLTLGCSAEAVETGGDMTGNAIQSDGLLADNTQPFYVGNIKGNLNVQTLADGSNGVQFMAPIGPRGFIDPAIPTTLNAARGGAGMGSDNTMTTRHTFKITGTAKRRVQILPFASMDLGLADGVDPSTGEIVDGFDPFGGTAIVTNETGLLFRAAGYVSASFKQVEV